MRDVGVDGFEPLVLRRWEIFFIFYGVLEGKAMDYFGLVALLFFELELFH
jgi:hypothetical protein